MRQDRSASQIQFGFLPEQTVDLENKVWKVKEWRSPIRISEIDTNSLRRELVRQATPWRIAGRDGGFCNQLEAGADVNVYRLDTENGVSVELFPRRWVCRNKDCQRLHTKPDANCECGQQGSLAAFHFVAYHSGCGAIKTPYIRSCPKHRQVAVVWPGSSAVADLVFKCPVCSMELSRGLPAMRCDCGEDQFMAFNVHRASQVFTPRTVVLVNPPSREKIKRITEAGGPPKALSWVLGGMTTRNFEEAPNTESSLRDKLLAENFDPKTVELLVEAARKEGAFEEGGTEFEVSPQIRHEAESQAVTISLATLETRQMLSDLIESTQADSELGAIYRHHYKTALEKSGLESIDFIDRFPVLTGSFGYTRGGMEPGESRLVPYRAGSGGFKIYGDLANTEAIFIRLNPLRVASWLGTKGYAQFDGLDDPSQARVSILNAISCDETGNYNEIGQAVEHLVHTYAHRFIRQCAVFAGVDQNSLSELLTPLHLGFFVYAAARGGFVLGGIQALFESELHHLLRNVVSGDHRCPLDPGCSSGGGACMACIHIGEPSCRLYNRNLDRRVLAGSAGYFKVS